MRPELTAGDEWLTFAVADLQFAHATVEIESPQVVELRCFHCQQAAEKAVKAVLAHLGIEFPWIHRIELLISLLPSTVDVPGAVTAAGMLTPYASAARYPDIAEMIDADDLAEALELARIAIDWAGSIVHPASE